MLGLYPRRAAKYSIDFLVTRVLEEMPFPIQRLQTDRGEEFLALSFQAALREYAIKFRPIPRAHPIYTRSVKPVIPAHHPERTEAMHNMNKLILSVFIFTFGFATATHAQQVNTLLTKQLPEAPGKELEVITVNYAPGAVDAMHRHDAHAVVYVLEGEVEMQVRGGTLQRLGPGQVFYESPEDVHTVSRNASKTKPAKFVVFFIKNEGAPILTPVH